MSEISTFYKKCKKEKIPKVVSLQFYYVQQKKFVDFVIRITFSLKTISRNENIYLHLKLQKLNFVDVFTVISVSVK